MARTLIATAVALLAGLALAAGTGQAATGSSVTAYRADGSAIAVRPLDDPANPYRGQYSQLERWVLEHGEGYDQWIARSKADYAVQRAADDAARRARSPISLSSTVVVSVDAAGWVLPQFPTLHQPDPYRQPMTPHDALNFVHHQPPFTPPPTYVVTAPEDALPAELRALRTEQQERYMIAGQPRIPAWLGTRPPLRTVFMPNGDVMAYGELGLTFAPPPGVDQSAMLQPELIPDGETWYRYSADGQLLGRLPNARRYGLDWFNLFWPQMQQTLDAFPRSGRELHVNGSGYWLALTDPITLAPPTYTLPDITVYAAWSYAGQPLDLNAPLPDELAGLQESLDAKAVAKLYELQVKYGVTDPAAVSPFEGQPDGPVVAVDPAPRAWPNLATPPRGGTDFVRLLPLDAPANPYRGQYTRWDDWIVAQHFTHKLHPPQSMSPEALKRGDFGEPINFYSTWRMVWQPVDAQGALLPLAQAGLAEAQAQLGRDVRVDRSSDTRNWPFSFAAQGELDDAQWTQYMAEKLRLSLPLYPAIPQWLADQPAESVVFAPNGDVVTYGPLGSFDAVPETKFDNRMRAGRDAPYYIYSPDGKFKGTSPFGQAWMDYYRSPELKAQLAADKAAGHDIDNSNGMTLVFAGPAYAENAQHRYVKVDPPPALLAAYDWDGTPLDITQPLTRPDYRGVMLQWYEVKWVHDVQALPK